LEYTGKTINKSTTTIIMILRKIICFGAVATMGISGANATTVNFDNQGFVALQDVTTQYAPQGVTFQGITDGGSPVNLEVADNTVFSDNNPPSLPFSLSNFYNHDPNSRAHIMEILFSGPVSGISFQYNGAGSLGANTVFNVFNNLGTLVDSFSDAAATDSNFHLINVSDLSVGEIDIVNPTSGWGHYIDDLTFSPSSSRVPDATSTSLLLSCAIVVLAVARKKLGV